MSRFDTREAPPNRDREALTSSRREAQANFKPNTAVAELRALAVQFRTRAVEATDDGDLDRAGSCEQTADRLYRQATELGDTGLQLPRLQPGDGPQDRFCVACRRRFQSDRQSAKYCSDRCRGKATRDRAAKGGKAPGQEARK